MDYRSLSAACAIAILWCAGPVLACEGRVVTSPDLLGAELCAPERPTRIVTLDPFYSLLMAGELGLPVVGTAISGDGLPKQAADLFKASPEIVGDMGAANLDAILALEPDLIIGDAYSQAEIRAQLEAIAPTALVDTADWKDYFRAIAEAAGTAALAEEKLTIYAAAVDAAAAGLPDEATVSFLRIVPGGFQVYVAGPSAYAPMTVLTELGLSRPPFETVEDDTVLKRPTMEGLLELQGDLLIYTIGGAHHDGDAEALEAEVTANPIWQSLPAVQAGRAYKVAPTHWMGFGGLQSAYAIVSDVTGIFAEK